MMGKIHLLFFFCDLRACMHACMHACMRVPCNFHVALQGRCSIGVVLPNMSDSSPFFLRAQNFTLVFPIYVCRVYVTCFCVISPLARKT